MRHAAEDTTIEPHDPAAHGRPRLALASRCAIGLQLAGLAFALLAPGCQTTARETRPASSDDVDRGITLPCTLPHVWYRPEAPPDFAVPFEDTGTLMVGTDSIVFRGEGRSLTIPTRAIEGVVWRAMDGDRQNEWAVIRWREGDAEKLVGFTAADRYRFDTSNRELYSALVTAWEAAAVR